MAHVFGLSTLSFQTSHGSPTFASCCEKACFSLEESSSRRFQERLSFVFHVLPVISTYLYYKGIFWSAMTTTPWVEMLTTYIVQDVSKWLLWGVQVRWRNKPIFHFLYSKSFKANNSCFSLHRNTCQAHSNSHYLKISRIVTPKETCLFSSLSMAGSGSSSRARSKSSFAYHVSRRSLHLLG